MYYHRIVNIRAILISITAFAAAVLAAPTVAVAQFSLDTAQSNTSPVPVITAVDKPVVPLSVINAARARADRKVKWRLHNTVDTKVSLTGSITHHNTMWTTNNQNALSFEFAAYYYHTYTTGRHSSTFKFDGLLGENYFFDFWYKNQDMFKLYYLASWKIRMDGFWKNWSYGLSTDIASQFAEGYKSRTERDIVWSNFFAPGTINLGAGITYTSPDPKLPFIVTVNPVSVNTLFVMDDRIREDRRKSLGIPGNPFLGGRPVTSDEQLPINYKLEAGSSLNASFNRTFTFGAKKGMTLQYNTTLTSFYGWITQVSRSDYELLLPEILPTFQWNNSLSFSPVKFIILEFRQVMRYDRSQIAPGHAKAGLQMQYYFRIGLTYRYLNK